MPLHCGLLSRVFQLNLAAAALSCHFFQYCFPNKAELKAAVDGYIAQDCTNNSGCMIAQTYGWPLNSWCVSQVRDMSRLFQNKDTFIDDISDWDVSSVTNMKWMFRGASSFNNTISTWDISSVTNMEGTFRDATSFNQDLCSWGLTFPYGDSAEDMFTGSGCAFEDSPQLDQRGPFCASECYSQPSASPSSSLAPTPQPSRQPTNRPSQPPTVS